MDLSLEAAIIAIASEDTMALCLRIEYLRRIDSGENHEDVLREFKKTSESIIYALVTGGQSP